MGLLLRQQQFEIRVLAAQFRQDLRQDERRDRWYDAEPEFAGQWFPGAARRLHEVLDVAQYQPCLHGDLLAGRRDRHGAVCAVHEFRAEVRLEFADGVAERRLRHEAALRSPPEMLGFGQGQEVLQLLECGYAFHR